MTVTFDNCYAIAAMFPAAMPATVMIAVVLCTGTSILAIVSAIAVVSIVTGAVAELVGIEVGVVSGVFNLESSGVEASDWRPRHDEQYHEA